MRYTFYGASSFTGTGVDLWNINNVKKIGYTFFNTNALTSCNKRKIADAWKSNAAFAADTYDTEWANDKCPVPCVTGTNFSYVVSHPISGRKSYTCAPCDTSCPACVKTTCTMTTDTVYKVSTISLLFVISRITSC